jgi:hypothetical protein
MKNIWQRAEKKSTEIRFKVKIIFFMLMNVTHQLEAISAVCYELLLLQKIPLVYPATLFTVEVKLSL